MPMADTDTDANPDNVFDLERLRSLIELMREYELSEVDLRQADQRVRVRRHDEQGVDLAPRVMAVPPQAMATSGPATSSAAAPANENIITINSPMVGTFYSKPNPDSESFVKVGDTVGPETVVCIIEAMKVFNEIQAEVSGRIVAVLVDNEEAVDHGKPLFKIDTSR
ncbi:MAG: acetyl-CoA carboxylase biotin carboxyl carrier protein [Planctomycetales bacterium]|nr:acetyl-CoA carboxylase biotin carboxyl carrier protein [Planctomycetales bacterium]